MLMVLASSHHMQMQPFKYNSFRSAVAKHVTDECIPIMYQVTVVFAVCSVDLPSYVAGSWLGMLPGTIAYVYAGNYGRALIDGDGDVGGVKGWQVALGLGITVLAVGYIGKLAKKALDDVEKDEGTSSTRS